MYLKLLQKRKFEPVCKSAMPLGYKEAQEQYKQISII